MRLSPVRSVFALCTIAVFILSASAQEKTRGDDEEPMPTDLVEETGQRLVQLDVTVSGPRAGIADLTREDFDLVVGAQPVEAFTVDNLCRLSGGDAPVKKEPATADRGPAPSLVGAGAPASYLFYFEQNHLTVQGRVKALDMARQLVEELIVDGNRGMVISSGRDLRTFVELTDDKIALLEGLDRLERDRHHWWDPTAEDEDHRVQQVLERLQEKRSTAMSVKDKTIQQVLENVENKKAFASASSALGMARLFRLEERWRTEKSLELFSLVLGRMADLDAPKAVVYFADTVRSNAGDHYMSYFAQGSGRTTDDLGKHHGLSAVHALDQVIGAAAIQGVRVYSVQAMGLVTQNTVAHQGNASRFRDAENTLVGLAVETGGKYFLHGQKTERIAAEIRDDLECLYLVSFDPSGYRMDSPLPVLVRIHRSGVKWKVRGRVVVQSGEKRLHSRLLAAFAVGERSDSGIPLHGNVIPTGFEKGEYSALVQLHVPGSPMFGTTWDLGLSLVSRGSVREDASGRVSVNGPGLPVVFETQMKFRPGPYEIVSVAHETLGDDVLTHRFEGEWPDADEAPASLGPIAVLQPEDGAFLRDTDLRRQGSMALGEGEVARPDRPTALVGIVCRSRTQQRPMVVTRHLVGESSVEFEPLALDLGEDRCAVFQDLVKAGTMTDGGFEYRVRVLSDEQELTSAARGFVVGANGNSGRIDDGKR